MLSWISLACLSLSASAAPLVAQSAPTVTLDAGTFTGTSSGKTSKFLGIPFAQPPVGDLRFRLPQTIPAYNGSYDATAFGLSCPQQAISLSSLIGGLTGDALNFVLNSIFGLVFPDSEDCLTINVVKPATATATSKLPVVVWIFGGGFELGSPTMYDGSVIVERSIALGEPIIYVSMNYRVTGFGFMAGKEVKAAGVGNLGLQDQRQALRWVNKYITAFGGDPTKVTIWGESAGAISVALQMIAFNANTEGLFRGAFMQSGSPIPVGDITNGQVFYDDVVKNVGCTGAVDTLECLRTVSYSSLKAAINKSPGIFDYRALSLAWLPRTDGVFLTGNPQALVQQGTVAKIPIVNGDCDDEGTLFSLSNLNVTTDAELLTYIKTYFFPRGSTSDLNKLTSLYPADITQGSPYDTGIFNALTPENKRIASVQGDAVFQAPRRFFLQSLSGKQPIWSFLNKRLKALPVLGAAHGTDILQSYGGEELEDYLIHFTNFLNPNGASGSAWPQYTTASPNLMTFLDGLIPREITQDTFRQSAISFMTQVSLANPI